MADNNYITQFEKECYQPAMTHMIQALDTYLSENMTDIFENTQRHMIEIFQAIDNLQDKGVLDELQTMSLSFLLTSLYQKKPMIKLEIYEGVPFLGPSVFGYNFPVGWLFNEWETFQQELLDTTSKLGLRRFIRPSMMSSYGWKAARVLVFYMSTIMKYWMRQITKTDAFNQMKLADTFFITYGEYMDWQQRIYGRQGEVDIFNCEEDTDLTYRQFEDKWYEKKTFKDLCLNDAYFKKCTFVRCIFDQTTFNDVRFVECTFKDCIFNEVLLYGASFIDTQLSHMKWYQVGIWGSGEETELQKLYGATDFIECRIESLRVKNTNLTGSRWRGCYVDNIHLENTKAPEEIKKILGVEEEEGE